MFMNEILEPHHDFFFLFYKKKVLVAQLCLILQLHGLQPAWLLCPWNSPGQNSGVGCHSLLQGTFITQGSNPGLLHCRQTLYPLSHQGSPPQRYSDSHINKKAVLLPSSAAAAAKLLQSCPTLCDPIPGILQARILEKAVLLPSSNFR